VTAASAIDWNHLIETAREARAHAYAPYSSFCVGAAILGGNGRIYAGCNVENASYGLAICAERSAVCAMIADGEKHIRAIAVVTEGAVPSPPCGMCRQVLAEFAEDLPVQLVSITPGVMPRTTSLAKLLPEAFRPDMLPSSSASGGRP